MIKKKLSLIRFKNIIKFAKNIKYVILNLRKGHFKCDLFKTYYRLSKPTSYYVSSLRASIIIISAHNYYNNMHGTGVIVVAVDLRVI